MSSDFIHTEENGIKYKVEYLGENYSNDYMTYKVIILGANGVGKTCIINKLGNGEFDNEYYPTISADIKNFHVKVNDKIIQIQIWDTCGNEKFVESTPNLFKNTFIALLVYAINDINSFNNLEKWLNILREFSFDNIVFLIGNKSDLKKERKVKREEAEKLKNSYDNIKLFFEISSDNGENINKLFETIAIWIYRKNEVDEKNLNNNVGRTLSLVKEDFTKIKEDEIKKEKKKCC